jgi:hypothetical protein
MNREPACQKNLEKLLNTIKVSGKENLTIKFP